MGITARKHPFAIHPGLSYAQETIKGSGGVSWILSMNKLVWCRIGSLPHTTININAKGVISLKMNRP